MAHDLNITSADGNIITIFVSSETKDITALREAFYSSTLLEKIGRREDAPDGHAIHTFSIHDADPVKFDADLITTIIQFAEEAGLSSIGFSWIPYVNAFNDAYLVNIEDGKVVVEESTTGLSFS